MEKMQDCEGGRKIEGDGGVGGVETFSAERGKWEVG